MQNLNIVLLGKTGHGKSATGNTIVRENRFYESKDASSYTKMVERYKRPIDNYNVQVFDTPGPVDTEYVPIYNGIADVEKISPLMESMIAAASKDGGVHAFFLVLSIRTRLTQEEMKTINTLEEIFGRNFFSDFGVLVYTHGDDMEEDFLSWCNKQNQDFKQLMAKFNKRFVLTTNKGEFSGRRFAASENMIKIAEGLKKTKKSYTLENYKLSETSRNYLLVKSKKEVLTGDFRKKRNELEKEIKSNNKLNTEKAIVFSSKINELKGEIKHASNGTDLLNDIYEEVGNLQILIDSKKESCSFF